MSASPSQPSKKLMERERLQSTHLSDPNYTALQAEVLFKLKEARKTNSDFKDSMEPVSFIAPEEYDVLLSDVHHNDLQGEIAQTLGVRYLNEEQEESSLPVEGILFGPYSRPMVNLVVSSKRFKKKINIIFLIDTGSPCLYVCEQAMKALGFYDQIPNRFQLVFRGQSHEAVLSPLNGHYKDLNLIGATFLKASGGRLMVDYFTNSLTLDFK